MGLLLNDDQILTYQRDGVVLVRGLFDAHWLEDLAAGIAENLRAPSSRTTNFVDDFKAGERFFYDARFPGEVEAYRRFTIETPMAETVAELMGSSRAIAYYISVFVRSPGAQRRSPWHQDQRSWAVAGDQGCSVWTSLDPVPRETALEFVRGSHRWGTSHDRPTFFKTEYGDDGLGEQVPFPDIEADRAAHDIVGWDMAPGDCVIFHGMTAHGGSGNLPPRLGRRAVSIQWLGDDARFRLLPGGDDPNMSADLLRHGMTPGDPFDCNICPVAWPRP